MELYHISESVLKRIVSMRKTVTAKSGCEHYVTCSKQLEFKKIAAYIQEKLKASSPKWQRPILNNVLRMNGRSEFQLIAWENLWRAMQISAIIVLT